MKTLVFIRWLVPLCFLPIIITGCDNGGDEQENPPPQSACGVAPASAFSSPTLLTAVNSADNDFGPEVTNGQLSLYLTSDRGGGYGSYDIYVSERASLTEDWGTPVNLGTDINTDADEREATVSSDGLTLIFASNRDGEFDLFMSTRNSVSDAWGPATNMGSTINSAGTTDAGPSLSEDGLTLVFVSNRPGSLSSAVDLYVTTRASTTDAWSTPINLGATVNSDAPDSAPDISCDGLRVYFHSIRSGNLDLWMTERSSLDSPWSMPSIIPTPVSTDASELSPSISADESTLYFANNWLDSNTTDIWRVTR
jgi:Tol biopolymer transport system component